MTLESLRAYGHELLAEEASVLLRIAMQTASAEDQRRYAELCGLIREIDARLHRAGGDGNGLTPVAM